jgi:tetratricopeptide (TPR) repeat protein
MAEKSLREVPRDLRDAYEKGLAALQRDNLDYAIAFFIQTLTREPALYECREALRAAQFKKSAGGGGFFKKALGGLSSSPMVAKAQLTLRSNPVEAIAACEQILNADPANVGAHKVLAEAALAADLPKTAALSLRIALKNVPRDRTITMLLGDALAAAGQIDEAESVLSDYLRAKPLDAEVAQHLKNYSARRTLDEGGYEKVATGEASYRDLLKDKDQAVSLEQEKREVKSDEVAERLIAENEARLTREPNNLKLLRDTASLHIQRNDYDRALACLQRASASGGAADSSLEQLISDTTLRRFDHLIGQLVAGDPEQAAQIEQVRAERAAFLLADTQRRAEKYPTDLDIRFELARLNFEAGKLSEAIQEFQKARNNPHRRLAAMSYLGQCFVRRGMNDLAAKQFLEAIREKQVFDDEKKELIYHLGVVLEKMGKREDAIEQFKLIYEADIGYRDVSARVDAYYSAQ